VILPDRASGAPVVRPPNGVGNTTTLRMLVGLIRPNQPEPLASAVIGRGSRFAMISA
jgi:ABC-type transport system involved in cytochrome c biogenesis ATPase subunit